MRLGASAPMPESKPNRTREEVRVLRRIGIFVSRNGVACIAALAALVTMALVPPDAAYLGYFDLNTLACLFSLLAVVRALRNIGFFDAVAKRAIRSFKTLRGLGCALIALTLACSMFATNDMALLMLLPLSTVALATTGNERALPFMFAMQAIAANLGGMILPFGNPQNIFLNSRFGIPFPDFLGTMALPFAVSVALIALCCLVGFKPAPLPSPSPEGPKAAASGKPSAASGGSPDPDGSAAAAAGDASGQPAHSAALPKGRTALYLALFAIALGMVFRIVPSWAGVAAVLAALLAADRRALAHVDWGLLATFAFFFVFSGNMARIPAVQGFFQSLLAQSTLVTSALASQVISNVPAAILLAPFADGYRELLVGVNIGGAGTLVASLASLIAFNHFRAIKRGMKRPGIAALSTKRYLALFTALNLGFLAILLAVCLAVGV